MILWNRLHMQWRSLRMRAEPVRRIFTFQCLACFGMLGTWWHMDSMDPMDQSWLVRESTSSYRLESDSVREARLTRCVSLKFITLVLIVVKPAVFIRTDGLCVCADVLRSEVRVDTRSNWSLKLDFRLRPE